MNRLADVVINKGVQFLERTRLDNERVCRVCVCVCHMCVQPDLRQGFLVLDLAGPQESQHIFGPLSNSMLHSVVMPQLFNAQLHPTEVLVTCRVWGGQIAIVSRGS